MSRAIKARSKASINQVKLENFSTGNRSELPFTIFQFTITDTSDLCILAP